MWGGTPSDMNRPLSHFPMLIHDELPKTILLPVELIGFPYRSMQCRDHHPWQISDIDKRTICWPIARQGTGRPDGTGS